MTMQNSRIIGCFPAAAGVITPDCRIGAGQRGCGGAGKTDYDKFSDPPGDVT